MNALVRIDRVNEMAQLAPSIGKVFILRERNGVLLNGPDQPFCIAILPGLTDFGHTDLHASKKISILWRGILPALVGMMNAWTTLGQGPPQRRFGQGMIEGATQMPAADLAGEDIHHDRQIDHLSR